MITVIIIVDKNKKQGYCYFFSFALNGVIVTDMCVGVRNFFFWLDYSSNKNFTNVKKASKRSCYSQKIIIIFDTGMSSKLFWRASKSNLNSKNG